VKRVVVTGASGFVGRHTFPELFDRGYEVHAVGRGHRPEGLPTELVYHSCDLFDYSATRELLRHIRASHLLHLAWYTTPGLFWESLENLRWVAATLQLYLAFAAGGGERAVMAGSCAEYQWQGEADLDEFRTPLNPRTLYGQSKHAVHLLLENASVQTNVSLAWGRIFFLYGPHEAPGRLISGTVAALISGVEAQCSEGTQQRDYMHVADAARAFVSVLDSDYRGPVNIASGTCVPVRTVVSILASLMGREHLLALGAKPRTDDVLRLAAAVDILSSRIGFSPTYDLKRGLAQTIAWWQSQRH
jgi:nucleoside-diphosphate-sugar epimerase